MNSKPGAVWNWISNNKTLVTVVSGIISQHGFSWVQQGTRFVADIGGVRFRYRGGKGAERDHCRPILHPFTGYHHQRRRTPGADRRRRR